MKRLFRSQAAAGHASAQPMLVARPHRPAEAASSPRVMPADQVEIDDDSRCLSTFLWQPLPPHTTVAADVVAENVAAADAAAADTPAQSEPAPFGADAFRLDSLTDAQRQKVAEAKEHYTTSLGGQLDEYGDVTMIRFFVMHNWDAKRAHKMMASTAQWRKKVGADAIRRRVAEMPFVAWPHGREMLQSVSLLPRHGEDRSVGRNQLNFLEARSFDIPGFFTRMSDSEFFEWNLHWLEYLTWHADRLSSERRVLVRQAMVVDAAECPSALLSLRVVFRFKPVLPLADAYYPEFLAAALILHANWFIHKVWLVAAPLLGEELRKRVLIADAAGSEAALMRLAGGEHVPTCLPGGRSERLPDELARAYVCGDADGGGGGVPWKLQEELRRLAGIFPGQGYGRHARAGFEACGMAMEA